jgi:hypothetical protein
MGFERLDGFSLFVLDTVHFVFYLVHPWESTRGQVDLGITNAVEVIPPGEVDTLMVVL